MSQFGPLAFLEIQGNTALVGFLLQSSADAAVRELNGKSISEEDGIPIAVAIAVDNSKSLNGVFQTTLQINWWKLDPMAVVEFNSCAAQTLEISGHFNTFLQDEKYLRTQVFEHDSSRIRIFHLPASLQPQELQELISSAFPTASIVDVQIKPDNNDCITAVLGLLQDHNLTDKLELKDYEQAECKRDDNEGYDNQTASGGGGGRTGMGIGRRGGRGGGGRGRGADNTAKKLGYNQRNFKNQMHALAHFDTPALAMKAKALLEDRHFCFPDPIVKFICRAFLTVSKCMPKHVLSQIRQDAELGHVKCNISDARSPGYQLLTFGGCDPEFLALKFIDFKKTLSGQQLLVENNVPYWDPLFVMQGGDLLTAVGTPRRVYLLCDRLERCIRVFADNSRPLSGQMLSTITGEIQARITARQLQEISIQMPETAYSPVLFARVMRLKGEITRVCRADSITFDCCCRAVLAVGDSGVAERVTAWLTQFLQQESSLLQPLMASSLASCETVATTLCSICMCPSTLTEWMPQLECGHTYCKDCFNNYMKHARLNPSAFPLKCHHADCGHLLAVQYVKSYATAEVFAHLKKTAFLRHIAVHAQECGQCPTMHCEQVFRKHSGVVTCDCCSCRICTDCSQYAHDDMSCEAAATSSADDLSMTRYKSQHPGIVCQCPNNQCGVTIEKNEGCNKMTCASCSIIFCWVCKTICPADEIYTHIQQAHPQRT